MLTAFWLFCFGPEPFLNKLNNISNDDDNTNTIRWEKKKKNEREHSESSERELQKPPETRANRWILILNQPKLVSFIVSTSTKN